MQFIRIESFTQQGQTVNLILKPPLILIKLACNLTQRNTYITVERIFNMFAYNTTAIMSAVDCVGCNDDQARPVRQVVCKHGDYRCKDSFDAERIASNILEIL